MLGWKFRPDLCCATGRFPSPWLGFRVVSLRKKNRNGEWLNKENWFSIHAQIRQFHLMCLSWWLHWKVHCLLAAKKLQQAKGRGSLFSLVVVDFSTLCCMLRASTFGGVLSVLPRLKPVKRRTSLRSMRSLFDFHLELEWKCLHSGSYQTRPTSMPSVCLLN